jgi:16S rRNA (uracil1498-N3)-methyltransferase
VHDHDLGDTPATRMTTPLFLLPPGALAGLATGAALTLDGDEGRHAATVRRIRAGERVDVADGAGAVARCEVTAAGRDRLELAVLGLERTPPPSPAFVLAQALAKGGRDELAVETATELGVDTVVPWQAWRSVVRWEGERGEKARRRWAATAREAAKQSRRPRVPVVEPVVTTAGLAARVADAALALVLHEDAAVPLAGVDLPDTGEVLLVVGPEGGISGDELGELAAAGGLAVRLGAEVLRASTAGPAALAVLSARRRWR